jgi:hypothetical protein
MSMKPFTLPTRRKTGLGLAIAIAFLLAFLSGPPSARAALTTFAQFRQSSSNVTNVFSYINNGNASNAQLITAPGGVPGSTPVDFSYLSVSGALPADLQGNQAARLTLNSSTKQLVQTAFGTIGNQQILGDGTNTLSIIRNAPALEGINSRTNLLTMIFTGQLLGALGGAPQLSGDTSIGPPYIVNFTSDFLIFANGQHSFSLTFSSWNPGLSQLGNYFADATAAGTGTFAADARYVPEPSSFALLGMGIAFLATPVVRRWRRKA